ncbi:hypothetical protein [Planotetraspora sp. GP83]|uniref:hypothetical protein n=1 Tax=Planotetraspora sp. GP83 TaxID=3156264 RepID=UPI00351936F0
MNNGCSSATTTVIAAAEESVVAVDVLAVIAVAIAVGFAVVILPGIALVIGIVIACVSCSLVSRHVCPVKPGRVKPGRFGAGQFQHAGPLLWPGWRWLVRRWPVRLCGAGFSAAGPYGVG